MWRTYALRTWNRSQAASCTRYDDDDGLFPRASRLLVCVWCTGRFRWNAEVASGTREWIYTECELHNTLGQMYCLSSPLPKSKSPKVPLINIQMHAHTHTIETKSYRFSEFTTIIVWIFIFVPILFSLSRQSRCFSFQIYMNGFDTVGIRMKITLIHTPRTGRLRQTDEKWKTQRIWHILFCLFFFRLNYIFGWAPANVNRSQILRIFQNSGQIFFALWFIQNYQEFLIRMIVLMEWNVNEHRDANFPNIVQSPQPMKENWCRTVSRPP